MSHWSYADSWQAWEVFLFQHFKHVLMSNHQCAAGFLTGAPFEEYREAKRTTLFQWRVLKFSEDEKKGCSSWLDDKRQFFNNTVCNRSACCLSLKLIVSWGRHIISIPTGRIIKSCTSLMGTPWLMYKEFFLWKHYLCNSIKMTEFSAFAEHQTLVSCRKW